MATETRLKSIQDLLPAIRTRRQEIEKARCMPGDLVEARETRIFRSGCRAKSAAKRPAPAT